MGYRGGLGVLSVTDCSLEYSVQPRELWLRGSQFFPLCLFYSMLIVPNGRTADSLIYPSSILKWLLVSYCKKIQFFSGSV